MLHYAQPSAPGHPGCWVLVVGSIKDPAVAAFVMLAMASGIFPTIVMTHDGRAHNDELFGVALFSVVFTFIIVVRTRDKSEWVFADHLVDIGGRHDGWKYLDHHQQDPPKSRDNGVKRASGGLVNDAIPRPWFEALGKIFNVRWEVIRDWLDSAIIQGTDFNDTGRTLDSSAIPKREGEAQVFPIDPDPIKLIAGFVNSPRWETADQRNEAFGEDMVAIAEILAANTYAIAASRTGICPVIELGEPRINQLERRIFSESPSPGHPDCTILVTQSFRDPAVSEMIEMAEQAGTTPRIVMVRRDEVTLGDILGSALFGLISTFLVVVRTDDDSEWEFADHLVGIGPKYDGRKFLTVDGANPPLPRDNEVSYGSAGLVFRNFVLRWLKEVGDSYGIPYDKLGTILDSLLIQGVDDKARVQYLQSLPPRDRSSEKMLIPTVHDPLDLVSGWVNSPCYSSTEQRNLAFGRAVAWMMKAFSAKTHEIAESMTIPRRLDLALHNASDPRILFLDCRLRKFDFLADRRFAKVQRVVFEDIGYYRVQVVRRGAQTILFPERWLSDPPAGISYIRDDRLYLAAKTLADAFTLAVLSLEEPFELTPPEYSLAPSFEEGAEPLSYLDPDQYEVFSDSYG